MIAFDLKCANGHAFEGWFEDNTAYESQKKKGLISCPVCNETRVWKIPSTFAIKTSSQTLPAAPEGSAALEAFSNQIAQYVKDNFDDVGCNFAREALKIHYGVSEPRNIRGVSTREEEKTLKKEGVNFIKVPIPAQTDSDA